MTEREGCREEGKTKRSRRTREKETDPWWLLLKKFSLYSLFRFKFLGFVSAFQSFTFSECYVNVKNVTVTAEDAIKRGYPCALWVGIDIILSTVQEMPRVKL